MKIQTTAYEIAQRFLTVAEVPGAVSNPQILAMLRLDDTWPEGDDVPWCSAFCNYVAWLLRLPRSRSLAARSWLAVGTPVALTDAEMENDVVVLSRGDDPASGHVGFYAGRDAAGNVILLAGNQGDKVSTESFPVSRLLGVRRLT